MRIPRRVPLGALLVLLAACQGARAAAGPAPHSTYPGPLASSIQVETLGDSARLVLQVTNATDGPVHLTFPSGQTYDFAVRDGTEVLWQWSADRSFLQAVRMITLAPGETQSFAEVWHGAAAAPGRTLTAVARLTSSDHPLERTAAFRTP